MRKFLFYTPAWLFLILLAVLFLVALSACGGAQREPLPTFTPKQAEYRQCLVELTRIDRSDENLDRSVEVCNERVLQR